MLIELANQWLKEEYPQYGKDGNLLTLEVQNGKVVLVGSRGGRTPLFKSYGKTLNSRLPKEAMKTLGPKRTEIIQQKDEEIKKLDKTMQEDARVANDENEQPSVRERARERITENTERRAQLEQEREQLVKKLPLRERIKALFKKYGFTVATVLAAVGLTIGVVVDRLTAAA